MSIGMRFRGFGGHPTLHAVEMTHRKGIPGKASGGRKWYQGHYAANAFVDPAQAPPDSGLLPASRADLLDDPIDQAQAAITSVLEETPSSWFVYFLRPAVGGAALVGRQFPLLLRIPAAIWGLYPLWQSLRK